MVDIVIEVQFDFAITVCSVIANNITGVDRGGALIGGCGVDDDQPGPTDHQRIGGTGQGAHGKRVRIAPSGGEITQAEGIAARRQNAGICGIARPKEHGIGQAGPGAAAEIKGIGAGDHHIDVECVAGFLEAIEKRVVHRITGRHGRAGGHRDAAVGAADGGGGVEPEGADTDGGRAGVGVGAGEKERAGTGLGQAIAARDRAADGESARGIGDVDHRRTGGDVEGQRVGSAEGQVVGGRGGIGKGDVADRAGGIDGDRLVGRDVHAVEVGREVGPVGDGAT